MGVGPQEKISTSASSTAVSDSSHTPASSVTKPGKHPGRSLRLASRLGTPHSSSSGMQAMLPGGMPATIVAEGRVRNGNGTSDPISTSGFHPAAPATRSRSARNTIGGMPTPPPSSSVRGRSACGVNGLPIGPNTLTSSPARRVASACSPGPTTL